MPSPPAPAAGAPGGRRSAAAGWGLEEGEEAEEELRRVLEESNATWKATRGRRGAAEEVEDVGDGEAVGEVGEAAREPM